MSTATNIQTQSARRGDPITSHLAAAEVTASGKRQCHIEQLESVLVTYPDGLTSAEIALMVADAYPHLTRHEVARRLPDGMGTSFQNVPAGSPLTAAGEPIRDARKCAASGRLCLVWYPTQALINKYAQREGGAA